MLIVTLPPAHQDELLRSIIAHPLVSAVRYNTGMDSAFSPEETLRRILEQTRLFNKPLHIDLKGRQLRVTEWATPPYGPILLNHDVIAAPPAKVFFRGDDCCALKVVNGRTIYVDPLPKYSVGKGQSINIVGSDVQVKGGLTDNDRAYIRAALRLGVGRFMLSFVEDAGDVRELEDAIEANRHDQAKDVVAEIGLKIESQKGVDFVRKNQPDFLAKYRLIAARDDLMIQIGGLAMLEALKIIVEKDCRAICASRLLLGIEQTGTVTAADMSDIMLMQIFGYRHFMFSDGISRKHFDEAINFWQRYRDVYPI